jgi:hypothetical protein
MIVLMDDIRLHGEGRPIQSTSIKLKLQLISVFLQDAQTHHQGSFGSTGLFKRNCRCTLLVVLDRGDPVRSWFRYGKITLDINSYCPQKLL